MKCQIGKMIDNRMTNDMRRRSHRKKTVHMINTEYKGKETHLSKLPLSLLPLKFNVNLFILKVLPDDLLDNLTHYCLLLNCIFVYVYLLKRLC